jgi:hypothetical protein
MKEEGGKLGQTRPTLLPLQFPGKQLSQESVFQFFLYTIYWMKYMPDVIIVTLQ